MTDPNEETTPVFDATVESTGIDPTPDTQGDPSTPGTLVNDPAPADPTPAAEPVADPAPADPAPTDPTPAEPVEDPAPADPTPAEPVEDPAPADPTPAEPVEEQDYGVIFEDTKTTTTTETLVEEEKPRREYSVQAGDTLNGIAGRLNIEGGPSALYSANKDIIGSDPNSIYPGLVLVLP